MAINSGFDGLRQPFSTSIFSFLFFFLFGPITTIYGGGASPDGNNAEIPLTVWKLVRVSFTHKPLLVAQDLFTLSRSSFFRPITTIDRGGAFFLWEHIGGYYKWGRVSKLAYEYHGPILTNTNTQKHPCSLTRDFSFLTTCPTPVKPTPPPFDLKNAR